MIYMADLQVISLRNFRYAIIKTTMRFNSLKDIFDSLAIHYGAANSESLNKTFPQLKKIVESINKVSHKKLAGFI